MGERIDIDGVRFKVDADLSKLKEGLKEGEKAGKESGAKTGSGFSQAFNAVAGAAIAAGLKGFLSNAANQFKQIESAMLRVDSIAKGFGRSISEARSQVQQLADKGFLNLQQSASAYADAIALGFDEKQARKFIDALSDVAAFQNTIGDGAAAVQSGVSGLLSNSAEKVENIGVPIKLLNQEYQKNIATMGKAAAIQKFYNGVLAESSKFSGDAIKATQTLAGMQQGYETATAKAAATVGKKLEPALKSLYEIGTKIANWLADTIDKLDSTTVAVVAFGTLAFTSISAFAKSAALLLGLFRSIGASATAALGPIGLIIAALGAAFIIGQKLRREWGNSQTRTLLGERDALIQQVGALQNATGKTKELTEAKAKLKQINDQITANYAQYLKYLDAENLSIEKKIDLVDRLEKAEKRLSMDKDIKDRSVDELRAKSKELDSEILAGNRLLAAGKISRERYDEELGKVAAEKAIVDAAIDGKASTATPPKASAVGGKATPEFRFIQARDALIELQKEYDKYIRKVGAESEKGKEASKRYVIESTAIRGELRGAIAEYNEERTTAALIAEEAAYQKARANIFELANVEKKTKEELQKELQDAEEAHIRKTANITAQSFAATLQGANAAAGGFANLINARDVGGGISGLGSTLSGLGGMKELFPELGALGPIGAGLGAVGGIASTLTGLFGKSDEQRAREAEAQKRRDEEAKALLELQANYQKSMLALQEAAARLPFENLSRQLRLIDINAQSQRVGGGPEASIEQQRLAARQAAIQGVISQESGTIGGGALFGGVQADAAGLTQFLKERASESVAVAQFMSLVNMLADPSMSFSRLRTIASQLETYRGKVPAELYSSVSSAIAAINSGGFDSLGDATLGEIRDLDRFGANAASDRARSLIAALAPVGGVAGALSSEITRDTSTAENLLSVIEQQLQTQQDIAKYTKATADKLSETPTRQSSIIDIARGYSRSLGAVLSPSLTNTGLPQSIAAAVLATDIQKSIQERSVKGIEDLVVIQRDSRELLAIIGKSLNSGTNANSSLLVQLEDLYRRSLAA